MAKQFSNARYRMASFGIGLSLIGLLGCSPYHTLRTSYSILAATDPSCLRKVILSTYENATESEIDPDERESDKGSGGARISYDQNDFTNSVEADWQRKAGYVVEWRPNSGVIAIDYEWGKRGNDITLDERNFVTGRMKSLHQMLVRECKLPAIELKFLQT